MCLHPIYMYPLGYTVNGKQRLVPESKAYDQLGRMYDPSRVIPIPCSKCAGCLDDRRRDWVRRMQLEIKSHRVSSFITLTYRDDCLPSSPSKRHLQTWLKRLRNVGRDYGAVIDAFRYFVASERGDKSGRLHYHGIIYGVDMLSPTWRPRCVGYKQGYPIYSSDVLARTWSYGYVTCDRANNRNIAYIANYILNPSQRNIRLCSQGLGRGFVLDSPYRPHCLNVNAHDIFDRGFYTTGDLGHLYRSLLPKSLYRYLDRYDPSYYELVRSRRCACARGMSHDSPSDLAAYLNYQLDDQKRKKTL